MDRYALVRLGADGTIEAGAVVAEGSAVQVVLLAWEDLVPLGLMTQLRLFDLPAAQRRRADRLRAARPAAAE